MMKRVSVFLVAFLMLAVNLFTACGGTPQPEFAFAEEPPATVEVKQELFFRDYLQEEEEAAEYTLYASFAGGAEEKQTSLAFLFEEVGTYNFRIERKIGNGTRSLTFSIRCLPPKPEFFPAATIDLDKGETKTFSELYALSQTFVTPSDLEGSVVFETVDVKNVEKGQEDQTGVSLSGRDSYTFDSEGIYTFSIKAENESGSATLNIVVNTYNKDNYGKKVALTYDPHTKIASWDAIPNATGYEVKVGEADAERVTEAQYSFANPDVYPDDEYEVNVEPVFGEMIYKDSVYTEFICVGRVKKPLTVSYSGDKISWNRRYLVEKYTVRINDTETYEVNADTFSYSLVYGRYNVNDDIKAEIFGTFDDDTVTETATLNFKYGEVGSATLKRIDTNVTETPIAPGVASGVEFIEFDVSANGTWFLTEWKGKNAPNYAVRAVQGYSEWDGTYLNGSSITPAGLLLTNSSEFSDRLFMVHRGTKTNTSDRGWVNDNHLGMYNYKKSKHYIQIVGWQPDDSVETSSDVFVYLFEVNDEDGTITLVSEQEIDSTFSAHALGGTKAVLYGNIRSNDPNDTKNNPERVSFKYARPAETLGQLLYGIADTYEFKSQLIELTGAEEPEPPVVIKDLSETATLSKITASYGIASDVEFLEFDGLSGDTWFMTQWVGDNAPNYAVRAVQGYSEWTEDLAKSTTTMEGYEGSFTPAGILMLNSAESSSYSMATFRGTNSDMGSEVSKRGTSVSGTFASDPNNSGKLGMSRYAVGTKYIQIVGYEILTPAGGTADTRMTVWLFKVNAKDQVKLVAKVTGEGRYSAHALQGSKAVIYGNIHSAGCADAANDNPDSITFNYVTPAASLEALMANVSDDFIYKAGIQELLDADANQAA